MAIFHGFSESRRLVFKIFSSYNTENLLPSLQRPVVGSCCLGEKIAVYCENNPEHINTGKTNNFKLWKCLRCQNIVQHKPYPSFPISPIRGSTRWPNKLVLTTYSVGTPAVLIGIFRGIAHCLDECRDSISNRSRPLPSKSFPFHLPTYLPLFLLLHLEHRISVKPFVSLQFRNLNTVGRTP
jgi:hypothetical protein